MSHEADSHNTAGQNTEYADFDVIVLGAGAAGETVAAEAARGGRRVALVENGLVGGERAFYACMPSKSLLHSARRGESWELAVARRQEITTQLGDSGAADRLAALGVTLVRGFGRVTAPGVLTVTPSIGDAYDGMEPALVTGAGTGTGTGAGTETGTSTGTEAGHDITGENGETMGSEENADNGDDGEDSDGDDGNVVGPTSVAVGDGRHLRFADLVLCTGSEPVIPPIEGLAAAPYWTTDQALTCPDLPRRLVVLGGDPAGCELAQAYASFGSQVTLIEREPRLLIAEAPFIGEALAETLLRSGVDVRLGTDTVWVEHTDAGTRLLLSDGGMVDTDRILLSAGRRPRVHGLGLEVLGIDPAAIGALTIDETCRVVGPVLVPAGAGQVVAAGAAAEVTVAAGSAGGPNAMGGGADGPGGGAGGADTRTALDDLSGIAEAVGARVWAAGDVTGLVASTHAACYQARVVAANLLGRYQRADYRAIPRTVHTSPSVCAVGISPAGAAELGISPMAAGRDLATGARSTVEGDGRGRIELYADPVRGVLIGGAAVGPYAEEWMSEITLAIRAEVHLRVLIEVVHTFPSYGETIELPLRELAERS